MQFFKKNRVALGEGHLDRYTLIEIKSLFSVYVHVFNTIAQDRFHTHAFDAFALVVKGSYEEEWKGGDQVVRRQTIRPGLRRIPRLHFHRLLRSEPNTVSIMITGPWRKKWIEETADCVRILTWGRKEVRRIQKEVA